DVADDVVDGCFGAHVDDGLRQADARRPRPFLGNPGAPSEPPATCRWLSHPPGYPDIDDVGRGRRTPQVGSRLAAHDRTVATEEHPAPRERGPTGLLGGGPQLTREPPPALLPGESLDHRPGDAVVQGLLPSEHSVLLLDDPLEGIG